MSDTPPADQLHHHRRRMGGRDTQEAHRAATPLELLFDLTFVVSFGFAASHFAHALAEGHYSTAFVGFGFASFGICWAWVNFSWFASAYDTDDWLFRLMTMIQMAGVLILAIGIPQLFGSLEHGDHLAIGTMVFGYVVMRLALVAQWLRAARQDPARRRTCLTYAIAVALAQVGWCTLAWLDLSAIPLAVAWIVLFLIELSGPMVAERQQGGTPWHAHHIVERNTLFAIIALGEGVVGTVAALSAVVETQGWTAASALVALAGLGLTFGIWWIYLMLPSATVLHAHRRRSFVWGYSQMLLVIAIVAVGAGLHVAALHLEHKAHISPFAVLLTTAIPTIAFILLVYGLYWYLVRRFDKLHTWLLLLTAGVMAAAVIAAKSGLAMPVCLLILSLAPVVTIIGYEWRGHRYQADALGLLE
ncbi:MAG: low temperature requirement protein A [Lysobacteraceae bacterium]|nr:low temperature requirement protein A [Xanthomonadales bacterium]HPF73318.1 low temperature requirement protein A [Xanthomonadaceae bacterium]HRX98748.1 low temperature requirement protein A [Xanthomonadaceae bacterium]